MSRSVRIFNEDGGAAVEIYSIRRDGSRLVMDVKVLDAMRMDMYLNAEEFAKSLGLVFSPGLLVYLLLYPFILVRQVFNRKGKL